MKTVYVNDLTEGTSITDQTFVVVEKKVANDKNGNPFYDLVLGDKTGNIKAKIWSEVLGRVEKKAIQVGKIVAVSAGVSKFRNDLQLTIGDLHAVDETKLEEYIESSAFSSDEMMAELMQIIESISDAYLKKTLQNLFADTEITRKFKYWPAALSFHHNFRSGLLQHVLETLALVTGIEKFYPNLNVDLVKAGLIMHDIGKLEEIDASGLIPRYSVAGSVLGHLYIGTQMVDKYMPEDAPENTRLHLKHIILSHHGEKEKGSPVLPATAEALFVSALDDASAKLQMGYKGVQEPADEIGMTAYNRFLSRWMWGGANEKLHQSAEALENATDVQEVDY